MEFESYRTSHLCKNKGKKYDYIYFHEDSYDSRVWKLEKEIIEEISKKLFPNKIRYYLDFACGTGRILEVFKKKAKNSYGIDVSEEMLKEARKKYKKTEFINYDLTKNKNIFTQKFDLITTFRFFLNAEKSLRNKALNIFYKLLQDNGFLICNTHGNTHRVKFLRKKNSKINVLSYIEMKNLLEKHKFRIIKLYGLSFIPYFIAIYLPRFIWYIIEKILSKIRIINIYGTHLIFVCKKS